MMEYWDLMSLEVKRPKNGRFSFAERLVVIQLLYYLGVDNYGKPSKPL